MPPINDNRADAIVIGVFPFALSVNNTDATMEAGEPNPTTTMGASVWYTFTLAQTGLVTVDLLASAIDTVVVIYPSGSDVPVAMNDDETSAAGYQSHVAAPLKAGTYDIQVGGYLGQMGQIDGTVTLGQMLLSDWSQAVTVGTNWSAYDFGTAYAGVVWSQGGLVGAAVATNPPTTAVTDGTQILNEGTFDWATHVVNDGTNTRERWADPVPRVGSATVADLASVDLANDRVLVRTITLESTGIDPAPLTEVVVVRQLASADGLSHVGACRIDQDLLIVSGGTVGGSPTMLLDLVTPDGVVQNVGSVVITDTPFNPKPVQFGAGRAVVGVKEGVQGYVRIFDLTTGAQLASHLLNNPGNWQSPPVDPQVLSDTEFLLHWNSLNNNMYLQRFAFDGTTLTPGTQVGIPPQGYAEFEQEGGLHLKLVNDGMVLLGPDTDGTGVLGQVNHWVVDPAVPAFGERIGLMYEGAIGAAGGYLAEPGRIDANVLVIPTIDSSNVGRLIFRRMQFGGEPPPPPPPMIDTKTVRRSIPIREVTDWTGFGDGGVTNPQVTDRGWR